MKKHFVSMVILVLGMITNINAQQTETCPVPQQFQVKWIEETEATAFWDSDNTQFCVYWKKSSDTEFDSVFVSNKLFYNMEGLSKGTKYDCYVRTVCGEDEFSLPTSTKTFITLGTPDCEDITSLPYTEDFEDYGISGSGNYYFPTCWTKISDVNTPNISSTKYEGNGGLYMLSSTEDYVAAVMPKLDDGININKLELKFMGKINSIGHKIIVGISLYQNDLYYFDTLAKFTPEVTTWQEYTVSLKNYNGSCRYITFLSKKKEDGYGNNYYIDNVVLDESEEEETQYDFTGLLSYESDSVVAWCNGIEIQRYSSETKGKYYDAIGEVDTTKCVSIYKGDATATFDRVITDGEGEDFVVFGNNYTLGQAYVEVSSDGKNYFRFDNKTKLTYNYLGTLYDLSDLEDDDDLDKQNIRFVRIVDDSTSGYCLEGIGVINASQEYIVADMEGLLTSSGTYEIVGPSTPDAEMSDDGEYYKNYESGELYFKGQTMYGGSFAMGFGASNLTGTSTNAYYISSATAGLEGENSTYLHAYYSDYGPTPDHNTVQRADGKTFFPQGVYVSNSLSSYNYAYGKTSVYNGYHKVIAIGYDVFNQPVDSAEVYLVQNSKTYKDWRFLDLSSFGEVQTVKFILESNYMSYGYLDIPAYFCLDNFTYIEGTEVDIDTVEATVCAGETFMGKNKTGTYVVNDTLLILTVNPLNKVSIDTTVCANTVFEFNNKQYTASQTIKDTIPSQDGCDTVYTVNLTVRDAAVSYDTVTVLSDSLPYMFGNLVLQESCDTVFVFNDIYGCDSAANLHLVVTVVIPCEDTTVTMDTAICANGEFVYNNTVYTTPQTIEFTQQKEDGCDSTVVINLSVLPVYDTVINDTVFVVNKSVVEYVSTQIDTFQSQNGCDSVVTVNKYISKDSGLDENDVSNMINIYPNPAKDNAILNMEGINSEKEIILTDINGRTLKTVKLNSGINQIALPVETLDAGIYYIRIKTEGNEWVRKLIKN